MDVRIINDNHDLPPLTIRQQKMLKAYLKHGNATQAYKDAGYTSEEYPDKAAHILIHRSPLSEHLEYFIARSKKKITSEMKTDLLWRIAEESVDITLDNDGNVVSKPEREVAIKAIAELNKMVGDYAPVQVNTQQVSVTAAIEDIRNARLEYKKDK